MEVVPDVHLHSCPGPHPGVGTGHRPGDLVRSAEAQGQGFHVHPLVLALKPCEVGTTYYR